MSTSHQQRYLLFAFTTLIVFFSFNTTPVSARLFPNVSSIPRWNTSHAPPDSPWNAYRNFTGCRPGKTYNGLSNLKNYFHYFGYISNVSSKSSNFSDDFDDALEAAVRAYQKNFNLNITGELDDPTMNQIVKPRCGVADIINGTTTMNSGKTNTTDSPTFHTVAHYSFFDGQPRWPVGTQELTYAFDPDNALDDVIKTVFGNAFSRWSEVTTISFRETASYVAADIRIGFYGGDHGDGEPFDGVLGTLAHAFSPTNGMFHLDSAEDWVASGDVTKASLSNAVDLESVAVHEIGHLLGLGHSSVEDAIMYPTITARTRKVELNEDDIQGIQVLYGSNPNFTGTPATSSRESDTSDGGVRHVGATCGVFFSLLFFVVFGLHV